jgi:hypothetical protein
MKKNMKNRNGFDCVDSVMIVVILAAVLGIAMLVIPTFGLIIGDYTAPEHVIIGKVQNITMTVVNGNDIALVLINNVTIYFQPNAPVGPTISLYQFSLIQSYLGKNVSATYIIPPQWAGFMFNVYPTQGTSIQLV